jgi:hypothetical protein
MRTFHGASGKANHLAPSPPPWDTQYASCFIGRPYPPNVKREELALRIKLPLRLENPASEFNSVQFAPSLVPLPHGTTTSMHGETRRSEARTVPYVIEIGTEVTRLAGGKDDRVVGSVQRRQLLQTLACGPWCGRCDQLPSRAVSASPASRAHMLQRGARAVHSSVQVKTHEHAPVHVCTQNACKREPTRHRCRPCPSRLAATARRNRRISTEIHLAAVMLWPRAETTRHLLSPVPTSYRHSCAKRR